VDAEHTAVLVGAGQLTQREEAPKQAMSPPELMAETARRAARDSGAGPALLEKVDYLGVVGTLGWRASNPARLVAEAVGAKPAEEAVSTIGGDTPQAFVHHIAGEIAAGRVHLAVLAGCNAMDTVLRASKQGVRLDWPSGGEGKPVSFGDSRPGSNDYENRHGLTLPVMIYPLFENAFRAHRGWDLETHRRKLGELFSDFSSVAASNPYSWFPVARTPEEIYTPSPENRMVAFPYTKYMNAVINVDQSAAVLMASVATARRLGIPEDRWVYLVGAGRAYEDPWWLSERPSFSSSPALREAGEQALTRAGVGIDEIDFVDLYSCFPSAVEIACEMLQIPLDGSRPLTVTGGLPFFGGPGNNYSTHAIASMMELLRERPGAKGLVTATGWYLSKHATGVYSTQAPDPDRRAEPVPRSQRPEASVELALEAEGPATIETYTVVFGRDGGPSRGIVVGRLEDGRRFVANTPEDPALAEALAAAEAIGRRGIVSHSGGINLFDPT
jgi:acetyl-CoA C-acetyltransferase